MKHTAPFPMLKPVLYTLLMASLMYSCGSIKSITKGKRTSMHQSAYAKKMDGAVQTAMDYQGTKYQYGGMSKKGIDCSGLVCNSYKSQGITLPRRARDMATKGKKISLKAVQKGDLLFFKAKKRYIDHVGMVISPLNGVEFIHSTSSKGVIISDLNSKYWKKRFVQARRIQ